MLSKYKKVLLIVAFQAAAVLVLAGSAHAGFAEFTLQDYAHPTQGTAGLFMQGAYFGDHFSFKNVTLTINTTEKNTEPFRAIISGDVVHQESGQAWSLQGVFDNFRFQPGTISDPFNPGSVPYDGIFDDWAASGDRSARLYYDRIYLQLTTEILAPQYDGPTELAGKQDPNGDTMIFNYQRFINPPNPLGDVFGATAWLTPQKIIAGTNGDLIADLHFVAIQRGNPVPEPGTMALMGLGLTGLGVFRRKKKS